MRGIFYGLITVLWIDILIRLDERLIGTAVALALVAYSAAALVIRGVSILLPVAAMAVLVVCPFCAYLGSVLAERRLEAEQMEPQERASAPFRARCLLYGANFLFGMMLGALLWHFAQTATPPMFAAFLIAALILLAAFVIGRNSLSVDLAYRAFVVLFAVVAALVLIAGLLVPVVTLILAACGWLILIVYTLIIFMDTQARLRKSFWRIPGICQVFATLGMMTATVLFQFAFPGGVMSDAQLILLVSLCLMFVAGMFSASNRTRQRPWGFSSLIPDESPEARTARRCAEIALDHSLTSRETEVLEQLAAGLSKDQIAETLVISPATAKTHIRNIYTKLGVHSRRELKAKLDR